jgi:hypothetical protein
LLFACESPQYFILKSENQVLNFAVAYTAEPTKIYSPLILDNEKGEIQVRVPAVSNASLTSMRVFITIPAGAVASPPFKGTMDLSKPYRFSVIAENGDKKDYLVLVYN